MDVGYYVVVLDAEADQGGAEVNLVLDKDLDENVLFKSNWLPVLFEGTPEGNAAAQITAQLVNEHCDARMAYPITMENDE